MELAKLVPPLPRTEYRLAVDTQAYGELTVGEFNIGTPNQF